MVESWSQLVFQVADGEVVMLIAVMPFNISVLPIIHSSLDWPRARCIIVIAQTRGLRLQR